MNPIFLLTVTIILFFLALKTTNKLWFEILWLLFGLCFLTTYYIRFDPSGSNASNNYNMMRIDALTLLLSYVCFLFLYLSSIWILLFKKTRWLFYLPFAVFGIIHFFSFFIMGGLEHFQLIFIEVFIPSLLAFLPPYFLLYIKFVRPKLRSENVF